MSLKRVLIFALVLVTLLTPLAAFAQSAEGECDVVYLFDAWARATPEGAPVGAVFGLLVNLSAEPDTLVSATTDVAEAVELHEMIIGDGDVMQMRPVEGGFPVGPDSYLELAPGGLHIMLINLTQPLEAGGTLDLVLNFEGAGEVALTVPIREMVSMDEDSAMGGGMDMHPETEMSAMDHPAMEWGESCAQLHVVGASARPAGAGMPNSAAYALLLNLTDTDDTLIAASTDAAEAVELHEMSMADGDVMQMTPVEGGVAVPSGGFAILKPGGLHIMLIGLTHELVAGETLDLTLTFTESGDLELTVPIHEPAENTMQMDSMS